MDFEHLPGGDLVAKGLQDLAASTVTVEALLVSIAAPRLRGMGVVRGITVRSRSAWSRT